MLCATFVDGGACDELRGMEISLGKQMELSFKLKDFEGPLDLLLHLIEKNKADILDIPIAVITDQYMEYLAGIEKERLENMSEFLVMAATLLDIKSRLLLPPEKDEDGEEIDPRDELVAQLLEYKMYKYMSFDLKDREEDAGKVLYRKEQLPREVKTYRPPVDLDRLLGDLTLDKLSAVFADVMKRQTDRVDPIRSSFGKIEKEEVDTRQVMHSVTDRIMKQKKCTFRSLLSRKKGKMYVVVTFLTILELMKMGRVQVEQEGTFGEILIAARDPSQWNTEDSEEGLESFD